MNDGGRTFTQAEVNEIVSTRLAQEKAKYDAVKAELATARAEVARIQPLETQLAQLQREHTALQHAGQRAEAFRAAGLDGEERAGIRDRMARLYEIDEPRNEKGEPLSFADWLAGPARQDPLISLAFAQVPQSPAAAGAAPDSRAAGGAAGDSGAPAQGAAGTPPPVPGAQAPVVPGGRAPGAAQQGPNLAQLRQRHADLLREARTAPSAEARTAKAAEASQVLAQMQGMAG